MTPGAWVVVLGVGGLGHLAIQIISALMAARIIAVDVKPDARALASSLGAEITVDADDDVPARIMDLQAVPEVTWCSTSWVSTAPLPPQWHRFAGWAT